MKPGDFVTQLLAKRFASLAGKPAAPKPVVDQPSTQDDAAPEEGLKAALNKVAQRIDTSSSITRALGGPVTFIEEFYFPPEIVGGMCPQVPGAEEETAWNAAAEACDSERVHIVWQSFDNRVWYLAIRSSEMASHPHSWCPFAALLPGMKEALTPPVCYTYYGDETASMMTVTDDGLHIYRGTTPIVRAKAERTARELGNASLVELTPDRIVSYESIPWYSSSLFEERARRILALGSVGASILLTIGAFAVWVVAAVSLVTARQNLADVTARTQSKTMELMTTAQDIRATPVRDALTKFAEVNEKLLDINGYLEVYAIKGGKARWRAVVPPNLTADRISAIEGKTIDAQPAGIVIGNAAEIEFEKSGGKK